MPRRLGHRCVRSSATKAAMVWTPRRGVCGEYPAFGADLLMGVALSLSGKITSPYLPALLPLLGPEGEFILTDSQSDRFDGIPAPRSRDEAAGDVMQRLVTGAGWSYRR